MTTQPEKTLEWRESQQWRRQGKTFTVEVYHYVDPGEPTYDDGRHRWNVYAYIYPGHPHFANFKGPDMRQDAATALPFHGGPSFLRWFYNDDKTPCSVKVGSDYNHLHDSGYSFVKTEAEAFGIFDDANQLFDMLAAREKGEQ